MTGVFGIPCQIWLPPSEAAPFIGVLPCTAHTDVSRRRLMWDFARRMSSLTR